MTDELGGPVSAPTHPDTAIRVYSGRLVDLAAPKADDILLSDIARSLANQQRFTGHCPLKPTIAQHSLAVEWITGERTAHADARREALMHDAAEAYVSDLSSPAKLALRAVLKGAAARGSSRERAALSAFDKLEDLAMGAIRERFGLASDWASSVKEADVLAYEYESSASGWNPYAAPPAWVKRSRYLDLIYSSEDGGEAAFLRRAHALGIKDA